MNSHATTTPLLNFIVDKVNIGIFVINKEMDIILWNHFMETYSGTSSEKVLGKNLFEQFPELPSAWLKRKINSVFILKNFAFTSWEQRPYLFKFPHNRPVTGGVDSMRQNCTFLLVTDEKNNEEYVCVTLLDVTDTSIYQNRLEETKQQLAEASNRDGLTGIHNRRYLEDSISKEFARATRYKEALSFIILDIDHFKYVNDNIGHLAGDEVLRRVAEILSATVRDTDTLARYGGEEFGIVCPSTHLEGAMMLAERVRTSIATTLILYDEKPVPITISLGVAQFNNDIDSYEELINQADTALYQSKEKGRNCATYYRKDD